MGNIFDRLGYKPEDINEAIRLAAEAATRVKEAARDDRVCVCGHAAKAHTSESDSDYHKEVARRGGFKCKPSVMVCPCVDFYPVLTSTNVRKFLYKTQEGQNLHALTRGIQACLDGVKAGTIQVDWIEGVRCAVCKRTDGAFIPIAVDMKGNEVDKPSPLNAIIHPECRGIQLGMGA